MSGKSKNWREGPAWQGRNTPGGDAKVSSGPVAKPEGTAMSEGGGGRKGNKAGPKTKHGKMGSRPATIYGG